MHCTVIHCTGVTCVHSHVFFSMYSFDLRMYHYCSLVQIIDTKARSVVGSIELLEESPISCLVHPATYLNKVLVGYESGSMELWNFRRKSLVHVFTCHTRYFEAKRAQDSTDIFGNVVENLPEGNYIPAITCIEQSPACDVVAVGFSSGDIILINLKFDEILFTFKQSGKGSAGNGPSSDHGGAVCSLSFRTDSAAEKFPYLVSGSDDGRLYVWYLGTGDNDDEDDEEEKEEKEPRKLMLTIDDAHSGRIGKVHFMYGEPILITSSEDNSLKTWIFDSPDGSARLLRSREGHSQGGPHRIRFYGGTTNVSMRDNADGYSCEMLSAGADGAFRLFNFAVESQNREMSQKPILKKLGLNRRNERLPEMTGFDFCETRQRDWADIVSIHKNHSNTYLWRLKNRVITETILRQPSWKTNEMNHAPDRSTHSSAVTLTSCGHFCIVGSKGGTIYVYNVQSGHPRGSYPMDASGPLMTAGKTATRLKQPGNVLHEKNKILGITENEKTGQTWKAGSLSQQNETDSAESKLTSIVEEAECIGHTGEVTGLFVDTTMSILVSSGLDGKLIFWDFNSHKILGVADNSSPILKMEGFRDGNFVAVVSQDRLVRVYDMTSQKLCRRFDGHSREVTDVAFSPDGRRLLTCSMDCTVRVWDMATARCLSWLKFDEAVVSMCLSLSGEYLCLTFTEKDGIYMYIDRSLYETVHFWKEPTEPTTIDACRVVSDVAESPALIEDGQDDLSLVVSVQAQVDQGMAKETVEQRGDGTITMSAIPKAYWTSLLNLEAIKLRNKPKSAPVAPPLAPFFLPTVVKAGESAPSFPTPAEYKKLTAEMNNNEKSSNDTVLGKRDASSVVDEKVENGTSVETNEVDDFKHMSSAWSDDGNEGGFGDDNEDAFGDIEEDVVVDVVPDSRKQSTSRIIRRRTELPR